MFGASQFGTHYLAEYYPPIPVISGTIETTSGAETTEAYGVVIKKDGAVGGGGARKIEGKATSRQTASQTRSKGLVTAPPYIQAKTQTASYVAQTTANGYIDDNDEDILSLITKFID